MLQVLAEIEVDITIFLAAIAIKTAKLQGQQSRHYDQSVLWKALLVCTSTKIDH
jgi:hypothetical protein